MNCPENDEEPNFFSISLSSRPVMDKSEIRSESIHFRNVNFRCGKYLNKLIDEGKLTKHGYRSTRVYSFPSAVSK